MTTEIAEKPAQMQQIQPMQMGTHGLVLQTNQDLGRFAKLAIASGLAPKGLNTTEAVMIALQLGAELGLSPMASLQNIAVINGRPSLWGDSMLAVCRSSGHFDEGAFDESIHGEGDRMEARCTVRREPNGKAQTRTFSVDDAKRAKLWGKAGPWTEYPKRMLQMRARGFALRDVFTDSLRGTVCAEEAQDSNLSMLPSMGSGHGKRVRTINIDAPEEIEAQDAMEVDQTQQEPAAEETTHEINHDSTRPADAASEETVFRSIIAAEYGLLHGVAAIKSRIDAYCGPESTLQHQWMIDIASEEGKKRLEKIKK